MSYHGPQLDPVPENVSVWNWLFGAAVRQSRNGIRDGETDERLSYRDLADQAVWASTTLSNAYGLQHEHTIAIVARNSIAYSVALFAAGRLGATVTLLPPTALAQDLAYYLSASESTAVFYDASTAAEVLQACRQVNRPCQRFALDEAAAESSDDTLAHLVQTGRSRGPQAQAPAWTIPAGQSNKKICAFLAFSSGTTGQPKAVMISHHNIIAQLMQVRQMVLPNPGPMLGILPYYHITGIAQLIHLPVCLDQELVLMAQFDMKSMLEAVVRYRCEELWLVPPLLIRMVSDSIAQNYNLDCVRQFDTGAAPLPAQIIDKLAVAYPKVALRQAWGMTESCSILTMTPPGLATYANATLVGKPMPGTEVRIVNPTTGQTVALGEEGELWVRGPQVTMGYRNAPEATAAAYTEDGYLRTGDLGTVRPDGFVIISDRMKEMIKVRGHGVAPAELEDVLLGHPKVADAAVIGIPHHYSGEVPKAYVAVTPGVPHSDETADELHRHVEARKARHMRLAGGIVFVDTVPKSASGKILRKSLRARHDEEQKAVKAKL